MTKREKRLLKKQKKQEKIKRKKEQKMFKSKKNSYNIGTGLYNAYNYGKHLFTPKVKPVDGTDSSTLNIVLFSQQFLNDLAAKCLPIAGGSEFQVHYRALQIVISKEGIGRIVYTFPTVFFNFNQTVTTSSVNYDLVEVDKISKELQPESLKIANGIASSFPKAFFEEKGFTVELKEDEVGSIHRHPGDFSFSSIDLDNNPDNPGVIYRRGNANDLIQTDSVMYITGTGENTHVKLVTTQTRVVDVKLLENDSGIEGSYKRAKTVAMIIKNSDDSVSPLKTIDFNGFFSGDLAEKEISETLKEFLCRFDQISESEIEDVLENTSKIFKIVSLKADVLDKVDENLIKSNSYSYKSYGSYNPSRRHWNTDTHQWEDEDDDDDIDTEIETFELKDVLEFMNLKSVADLTSERIRELFWNVQENQIEFKIQNNEGTKVIIEEINNSSQLLKVTIDKATVWKSKGIYDNNDISEELKAAGYISQQTGVESALDDVPDVPDNAVQVTVNKPEKNVTENDFMIRDTKKCKEIFKKCYPYNLWDNNGLLKVYSEDGFYEIAVMLPANTGIEFSPSTEVGTKVTIAPIGVDDTHASVSFENKSVKFHKSVLLYRESK